MDLIPQAFTTRDMSEAYKWLQGLPPTVREEMKSMEQVVSLYLRAKRLGHAVPTREDFAQTQNSATTQAAAANAAAQESSKSSQDFQKTLKNLRHELEQFDFAPQGGGQQPPQQQPLPPIPQAPFSQPQPTQTSSPHHIPLATENEPTVGPHQTNILSAVRMDPKSRQIMDELREGLNLSSNMEVVRMSLVLAHKALSHLVK